MSAERVARALVGRRNGSGWLCRCPVAGHGQGRGDRNPSLSIRDGDDRLLVCCHSGCDPRDVLEELRRRGLLDEGGRRQEIPHRNRSSPKEGGAKTPPPSSNALSIWHEARPRGTVVEKYLAGRGLNLPDEVAGSALRFHPSCPFGTEHLPCMIALYRDINTNNAVAIHRTALTLDGQKIGRKMLGPVSGAAIKLDADDMVTGGLHVGEGIESCLAARQIGFKPVWALGSAGAISAFPVLPAIECLSILTERDETNAKAVQQCGERWIEAGREVLLVEPLFGKDVNDTIRSAA